MVLILQGMLTVIHAQIGNSLHNYGVPSDAIIRELKEICQKVFSTLGKSKRSFIQIEDIDLAVKDIRKNFYSADEFSESFKTFKRWIV